MLLDNTEKLGLASILIGILLAAAGAYIDLEAFLSGISPFSFLGLLASAVSLLSSIPTTDRGWLFLTLVVIVVIVATVLAVVLEEPFWTDEIEIRGGSR